MSAPTLSPFGLNFTKLSKGIAALLGVGYVVQLTVPSSRQYLCLVAGRFIPCVWNVFTAGLVETSILQAVFSAVGILMLARIIEPIWGSKEFLKFLGIVNLGSGLTALAVLYVCFVINSFKEGAGKVLYMEVSGFHGVLAGCLVAVKQLIPDTEVTLLRVIRFHAKYLPGIFLLIAVVGSVATHSVLATLPLVVPSMLVSWLYLRYLQVKPGLNLRGDPSDEFRFATFFPQALHPAVDNLVRPLARILRLQPAEDGEGRAAFGANPAPLPGSDNLEAARRRERGAKVLEERMTASGSKPQDGAGETTLDVEAGPAPDQAPGNGAKE